MGKTKKADRIRLTSSVSEEVQNAFSRTAGPGGLLSRGCLAVSAFCNFRMEVL